MKYTTIMHEPQRKLGISTNEYIVASIVYRLSAYNGSNIPGWCYASKQWFADTLGISKAGVHKIINRLIDKRLIERDQNTSYLRATSLWYDTVEVLNHDSKQSLPPVNKVYPDSKQSLLDDSKQSLPNSNNIDNIKYNKAYILKHKDEIVAQAKQMYKDKNVDKAMFDFIEHITINKKKWSNFKLAFFRWVREDQYNQYAIKQPNYKRLN